MAPRLTLFALLLASAGALQTLPQLRSRSVAVTIRSSRAHNAWVVRRATEEEQDVTDLNLEEMFDIFEKADQEVTNAEVGMAEGEPAAAAAASGSDANDNLRSFVNGDLSNTPVAYQVGLAAFVALWAVILGGQITGNPVV